MANSNLIKFKDKKGNQYPYLYIDAMTGIFYAVIRIKNKTRKRSLDTNDFNIARSLVMRKAVEIEKEEEPNKPQNFIFEDFYNKMIAEKTAANTKESTMERIESVWRLSLKPFWEYQMPEDINQDLVTEFMNWHKRMRPGIQFINAFKYLNNIFNVMVRSGALSPVNLPQLEVPRDEAKHHAKQKGRYLTDSEVQELLKHVDSKTELRILLSFCTGMRKMEIGGLEKDRIKLKDGRYTIVLDTDDTKTGLAREIPVPTILTQKLKAQLDQPGQFLFSMKSDLTRFEARQTVDKGWVHAKELTNIHARFHDLRHTAATNFAKSNINPIIACTILGMSFKTYQKTYLKLNYKDLIMACEANADRLSTLISAGVTP